MITHNEIHLAPLQSFTDIAYRSCFAAFSDAIDFYYTPYMSTENDGSIRNIYELEKVTASRDLITIPQILPANLNELKTLIKPIIANGYRSVNINAGCPYPMVINKGRGAGLMQKPQLVADFIRFISDYTTLEVSVKTRLGITDNRQIMKLLENISDTQVKLLIIHARNAKQMYRGYVFPEEFRECTELFPQLPFVYNGDIFNINDFKTMQSILPQQRRWMLGRGVLMNPLLPYQIKHQEITHTTDTPDVKLFCLNLVSGIEKSSKNEGHAMNRISTQMNYLNNIFQDGNKLKKKVGKMKSVEDIRQLIMEFSIDEKRIRYMT